MTLEGSTLSGLTDSDWAGRMGIKGGGGSDLIEVTLSTVWVCNIIAKHRTQRRKLNNEKRFEVYQNELDY